MGLAEIDEMTPARTRVILDGVSRLVAAEAEERVEHTKAIMAACGARMR